MKIRLVLPADNRNEISRVYEESWKYAYRGIVPQSYLDSIPSGRWADAADRNGTRSLILLDKERIVGTSSVSRSRFTELSDWGEIISLYLLPEYIGKGFGRALLCAATEELRNMGFESILLWVLEENARARRFYERSGFCESGEVLEDQIGGKPLREIQYIKK